MDQQKIVEELDATLTEWSAVLSSFSQEEINKIPFEGSWTAGQVARHLNISNSGFLEILNGPESETNRPADQKVGLVKSDFLNFTTKMQAPDFVLPKAIDYDQNTLISDMEMLKSKLTEVIRTLDLTRTCTAFELPGYGYFTRWEAIYFVIYHSQRHLHQLKNIYETLNPIVDRTTINRHQ